MFYRKISRLISKGNANKQWAVKWKFVLIFICNTQQYTTNS